MTNSGSAEREVTLPRPISPWLVLGLVVGLHADWHLARSPEDHPPSFGWSQHWLFCLGLFALVAWRIHRRWPARLWPATAWNVGLGLIGAQVVEPLLESIGYLHRIGYLVEADRWKAFGVCVFAGGVSYFATIWALTRRGPSSTGAG